ncbi:hypothetical protein M2101_001398, partial [Parabacteroides sp. PM5-20]|uniref:beta strand repeat-containing protein n=1 Tax=Parabacteroides sp. PM5-20 TaxID=2940527 RepID=UPI0024737AEC
MKQIDLRKQTKSRYPDTNSSRWRLWCMMLFIVLMGTASSYGQISWTNGFPRWDGSESLVIEGDASKLEIQFTTSADIATAGFELTLPANVKCTGVESMNGITYHAPTTSGQTATIRVSTNGGTIPALSTVHLKLNLKAACGAVSGSTEVIRVKPLTGSTAITGADKEIQAQLIAPSIMIKADQPTETYSGKNTFKTLTYKLSAAGALAKTYKVILNVDAYTTLQNFELDGVTKSAVFSSEGKTYTLTLSDLSTTEQVLTFEAASSRLGEHLVTPTAQYPAATACLTEPGQDITMSLPSVSGSVTMTHISTSYVDSNDDPITTWDVNMDGETKNMVKVVFKNDGTLDAWDGTLDMGRDYCRFLLFDKYNIKYQIEGDPVKKNLSVDQVKVTTTVSDSQDIGYFPDHIGEPIRFEAILPDGEIVPSGKTVTFWVPTVNGKTYNNGVNNVYFDYSTTTINGLFNTVTAKNEAGEKGGGSAYMERVTFNSVPHFRELPTKFMIKQNGKFTQTIRVSSGSLLVGKGRMKIHLQLPAWLKLDESENDNFTLSQTIGGTIFNTPVSSDDTGKTPYKIYTGVLSSEGEFTFKYTTDGSFPAGSLDQIGEIGYYIDYEYNGYWLKNISQVFQPVTLSLQEKGIVLENVSLYRITRGLKDTDEDHIPDSNDEALDGDINHSYYMVEDKGELRWNTRIVGTSYKYLYLPVTGNLSFCLSDGSNKHLSLLENEVKIKVNGSEQTYPVSVVANDGTFYVEVDALDNPFVSGSLVDIFLPFKAKQTTSTIRTFTSECFVSNQRFTDPLNSKGNTDREGDDLKSCRISSYSPAITFWYTTPGAFLSFGNEEQNEAGFYFNTFHSYPSSPYFKKEVRRHAYPMKLEFTLPDGYVMYNDDKIEFTSSRLDGQGPSKQILSPSVKEGNTYEYDLSSFFDYNFKVSGDALDATKWMLPDDKWDVYFKLPIQATKGVTFGNSELNPKLTVYDNNKKQKMAVLRRAFTLDYKGVSTSLTLSTPSLNSYGSSLTLPVITVGNPNETALDRVWLYVDGNVSDLSFTEQGGSAQAVSGKWFSVNSGSGLAAANNKKYQLDFKHLGRLDGKNENDTIWIYTVSDFGDTGYTDPTNAPLDVNDLDHVGARQALVIVPASAKISGSLSVDNPSITYNTPYTLTAVIDGTVSPGVVRNPKIRLTLPVGQDYVAGSLSLNYAGSSTYDLSALEALLVGGNGTATDGPAAERSVEIDLAAITGAPVLFPGTLSSDPTDTDIKRKATVTANFKPMCNTDLTGFRFTGGISADNITDNITKLSPSLLPALSSDYGFEVRDAVIVGGNRALNELQTTLTLQVKVMRNADSSNPIETGDYVLVKVPEQFSLNGTAQVTSTISNATGASSEIGTSDVSLGSRYIKLSLPTAAINADASKGFGKEMVYEIPLVWDPNYATALSTPTPVLEVKYISSATFNTACSAGDVTLGETSIGIAVLTAGANPYEVTVGEQVTMNITTANFEGKWYSDSNLGTEVSAVNPYTLTPSVVGDIDYYVSALIDGEDYGSARVQLKVYPSLAYDVTDPSAQCGEQTNVPLTDFEALLTNTVSGVTYSFYSSNETNTDGSLKDENKLPATISSIPSTTTYYVQSYNGLDYGTPKSVVYTIHTIASFTTNLNATKVTAYVASPSTTQTFAVEAAGTSLTYQWYKATDALGTGETAVSGVSNTLVLTITNESQSGFYYVKVTGCNGTITSNAKELEVIERPDDVVLNPASVDVSVNALTNTISLNDKITYTNTFSKGETIWYSLSNDSSTAIELTAGSTITLNSWGSNTLYVWAKNPTTDRFSDTAAQLTINLSQNAPANVVLKGTAVTYCDTELTGKTLWDQIDTPDAAYTYWYSTDNGVSYASEVKDGTVTDKVQLAAGTYLVKSKNSTGGFSATAATLTVTVNTSVTATLQFDGELATVTNKSFTVGTEIKLVAGGASGSQYYRFYKGTTALGTAQPASSNTYTINPSASTDGGNYSVKIVKNSNGDEDGFCTKQESDVLTVAMLGVPADVVLNGVSSPLDYCGTTDVAGNFLWDMIDHTDATVTYHYSINNGTTYTEVNAGNPVQLAANTYLLKAKNTADGYSANATTLQVNVNTPVTATLHFDGELATVTSKQFTTSNTIKLIAGGAPAGKHYRFYQGTTALGTGSQESNEFVVTSSAVMADAGSYTVKIVNAGGSDTGFCTKQESDALIVTMIDKPEDVTLTNTTGSAIDCTMPMNVTIDDKVIVFNTTDFTNETFWWNTEDNKTGVKELGTGQTASLGVGTHTIYVWAKNNANYSDIAAEFTLTVSQYTAVTLGTVTTTPANGVIEAPAGSTTNAVSISVTGTSGSKNSGGEYVYRLYDTTPTAIDDNTTGSFSRDLSAPTATASEVYTYYVSAEGACTESAKSSAITFTVYPDPVITLVSSPVTAYCSTDGTLTAGIALNSYISGANTTLYDYYYTVNGGPETALTSSVQLPKNAGTYNYVLIAKNKYASSTKTATATLSVVISNPVALETITTPVVREGAGDVSIQAVLTNTSGSADTYKLFKMPLPIAEQTQDNGSFTVAMAAPTNPSTAFETSVYYITAQGAISCNPARSNNVEVRVYPTPVLSLSGLAFVPAFCEDDQILTSGIDLWNYIDGANRTWFDYSYSTDGGNTYSPLQPGTVTVDKTVGTHVYMLKAVNKLPGSTLEATETITIKVDRQTKITKQPTSVVVTEWDAFTLSVDAVAEGAITYQWEKWNTYLQVFETVPGATSATYVVNRSVAKDAGLYRVVVTGGKGTACGKKVIPSDEVNVQV